MTLFQRWYQNTCSFCYCWTHIDNNNNDSNSNRHINCFLVIITLSYIPLIVRWNSSCLGSPCKKDKRAYNQYCPFVKVRKKIIIKNDKKIEKEKERKGLPLRILPRRHSFDDKPFYKVSSCTVQNTFGQRR